MPTPWTKKNHLSFNCGENIPSFMYILSQSVSTSPLCSSTCLASRGRKKAVGVQTWSCYLSIYFFCLDFHHRNIPCNVKFYFYFCHTYIKHPTSSRRNKDAADRHSGSTETETLSATELKESLRAFQALHTHTHTHTCVSSQDIRKGKPGITEPFLRCFWNPLWEPRRVPTPSSCSSDESFSTRQHLPRAKDRERRCEQIGCETEASSKTSSGCQERSVQGFTLHAKDTHGGSWVCVYTASFASLRKPMTFLLILLKGEEVGFKKKKKRKIRLAAQLGSGRVGEEPAGPLGWGRRRKLKAHQKRRRHGLEGSKGGTPLTNI